MDFPPSQVSPRIVITDKHKREAEVYAYKTTIRGLLDLNCISESPILYTKNHIPEYPPSQFIRLLDRRNVNAIPLSARAKYNELLEKHTRGLHGEMAFNIYRKKSYRVAFKVAESYVYHDVVDCETGELLYPRIYPDACLNASCSVLNFCLGSKTIDVKCQSYEGDMEYVGLGITDYWWLNHSHDDFYVAVSERREHIASYDNAGKRIYKVIDYAILGYATMKEVDDTEPSTGMYHYRNIHFDKLHPIDCLTPKRYVTSETVSDRMPKAVTCNMCST